MKNRSALIFSILSLSALVACGNGSIPYVAFAELNSNKIDDLQGQRLNSNTATVDQTTGELDRGADTYTLGTDSGTISLDRTLVTLSGGGTVDLTGVTDYSRFYEAQPNGGTATRGVVGIPTRIGNMPKSSTGTYTGVSRVGVIDTLDSYDLTGDVSATADFANGTLNVVLDNLDGTRTEFLSGTSNVSDVATIAISGATITGNTASGGASSLVSAMLNGGAGFSGAQNTQHEAGFYGPRADELGGAVIILDGGLQIFGEYLAD